MTRTLRILRSLPLLLAAIAAAIGSAAPAVVAQTTITLNLSMRWESPEAAITLGKVASLTGPDAARYSDLVVLDRADTKPAISLADVRAKLQTAGANFGTLTLRGSSCRIELPDAPAAAPTEKPARARSGPDYQVVDTAGPPTLRTAIARRLAAMHDVAHDEIQIAFDEKDALTLATPYSDRQVVQIQPAASASSSRVPLRISVFAGDTVVADYRLTADILLRREALIAARDLDRRDIIADADVLLEPRWIAPGVDIPSREAIVGSQVRSRVKQGAAFDGNDLESPVLIKRGDVVYVQCLSGSIVVQARARALASGRDGETIAFQIEGADDSFSARVAGRGRAVMLAVQPYEPPAPAAVPQTRR